MLKVYHLIVPWLGGGGEFILLQTNNFTDIPDNEKRDSFSVVRPVLPCYCSWTKVASTQIMCRCAHTVLLPTLSQLCSGGNLIPQLSPLLETVLLFVASSRMSSSLLHCN